ncbi:MAG TPA: class I SAM-dependent methyltransferase [Saprospiraceae bacterium]|nr:class I SAM-dependent methyltransferase [Saprospiraceae bacterium]
MSVNSFDAIATEYDLSFSESKIGKAQRNQVHAFLNEGLGQKTALNILELNCGTGIDAIYLAAKNHKVLATDISEGMIDLVNDKIKTFHLADHIQTKVMDIKQLEYLTPEITYDLIFSNFGGFNCLSPSEIQKVSKELARLLADKGQFIAVVMPGFCLWETLYFLAKLSIKKAFRRFSKKPIPANLDAQTTVNTWYYSPGRFFNLLRNEFKFSKKRPIGFFIPPSYLTWIAQRTPRFFNVLVSLEKRFANLSLLAFASDHYYIEVTQK